MAINVLSKTSTEERRFKFDCSKVLGPSEKIVGGIDVDVMPMKRISGTAPENIIKGVDTPGGAQDGPRHTDDAVYVKLAGGKDEEDYRIVVSFRTRRDGAPSNESDSRVQVFGDLRIRDITTSSSDS